MTDKHKVFISYHHGDGVSGDWKWKDDFLRRFAHVMVDWSVRDGDIPDGLGTETVRQKIRDEFLRESTVTVVLIGAKTWGRKHVDWEIGSSLSRTKNSSRSGLLGVLLPTYPAPSPGKYDPSTIPPRLEANLSGSDPYARLVQWTDDANIIQSWIHTAFLRRSRQPDPDNSLGFFGRNRT